MELEGFKSAWQKQAIEGRPLSSPDTVSRSLQFLRTSAIRDLQRSEELARFIFSLLFALVSIIVSFVVLPEGAGRVAAWLFAAALLVDGTTSLALLTRRMGAPVSATMREFIFREHRQVETRLRFERYSHRLMFILTAIALLVLLLAPRPAELRVNALDALERMTILTAFLILAWRRAKSRSREIHRELEGYLKDLQN